MQHNSSFHHPKCICWAKPTSTDECWIYENIKPTKTSGQKVRIPINILLYASPIRVHFYCKRHIQSKRFRPRCPEFSWFAKNPNRSDHQPRRRMRPVALTSALLLMLTRPQSKSKDDLNGNVQESQYGHNMLEAAFWPVQCSFVNLDLRPSSDWHDSISHIYVCRTLSDDCPRAGRVRRTPKDGQEDERIEDDVSCFVNLLPLLLSKNLRFRSSSSRITKTTIRPCLLQHSLSQHNHCRANKPNDRHH